MTKAKSILSWNVNGIRAVLKKGFEAFLAETNHDIVCLQETKISEDLVHSFQFENYPHLIWNWAEKKGYSGTAIFSKQAPLSIKKGIGIEKHDKEGRVISVEFEDFYLVTVYTPNAQGHDENRRPKRLDYRTKEWDVDFLNFILELEKSKPVIFCGDLNVAHKEIDLANPSTNRKNAGFTDEERQGFQSILDAGYLDIFRELHPDTADAYTWWSYRANARANNVGWRIDYFCVSEKLRAQVDSTKNLTSVLGSDHCPITLSLK